MKRTRIAIIDRRENPKGKSAANRERFLRRYKQQISKQMSDEIGKRKIEDMEGGMDIKISRRTIDEPSISHGRGGDREYVLPGNREYIPGDEIPRPEGGGGGGGGQQAGEGESIDEFTFSLSREEFMKLFFDDLELPNLERTILGDTPQYKFVQRGFTLYGTPSRLNVQRTIKMSIARRIAFRGALRERLKEAEAELRVATPGTPERDALDQKVEDMRRQLKALESEAPLPEPTANEQEAYDEKVHRTMLELSEAEAALSKAMDQSEQDRLARLVEELRARLDDEPWPFLEEVDQRFRNTIKEPKPIHRAVMFCLMDVSASMDEEKKDLAKRFFTLLYLFLTRKYERVDIVFIRHTDDAEEVDEETFFHDKRSGGTVVLSALELAEKIRKERYADGWNVYAAQASDGDAFGADPARSMRFIKEQLLPRLRYFFYIETGTGKSSLWSEYSALSGLNFAMKQVSEPSQIYPVFRDLFRRKETMK